MKREDLKKWLPPKAPERMTVFTPEAWLRPRRTDEYSGGDIRAVLCEHTKCLAQELALATDDQLRELGKSLDFMHRYKARLVVEEAERRGLI